jgi:uncharacterized protein (TIGR03435 family)
MRTESRELLAVGIFGGKSRVGYRIEMLLRRSRTFSPRASATGVAASAVVLSGLLLAGALAPRWIAFAQQAPEPAFEAASVKPGDPSNASRGVGFLPGGRIRASNATLKMLIMTAWNVRDFQVSGGPSWLDSERYSIEAEPGRPISVEGPNSSGAAEVRQMLQSLLAVRFQLSIHRDTKEMPMYALVLAKNGAKLKENPLGLGPESSAGGNGRGQFNARQVPIAALAPFLSNQLGRVVVDRTALKGVYDFKLEWSPDPEQTRGPSDGPGPQRPSDVPGPSIFTALQEQLGLKLEPIRGPVETLVIDHVEKPDAN